MSNKPLPIILHSRVLGHSTETTLDSLEDALEHAVLQIDSGKAIPKRITRGDRSVYTESDINTYWQQCRENKSA